MKIQLSIVIIAENNFRAALNVYLAKQAAGQKADDSWLRKSLLHKYTRTANYLDKLANSEHGTCVAVGFPGISRSNSSRKWSWSSSSVKMAELQD